MSSVGTGAAIGAPGCGRGSVAGRPWGLTDRSSGGEGKAGMAATVSRSVTHDGGNRASISRASSHPLPTFETMSVSASPASTQSQTMNVSIRVVDPTKPLQLYRVDLTDTKQPIDVLVCVFVCQ